MQLFWDWSHSLYKQHRAEVWRALPNSFSHQMSEGDTYSIMCFITVEQIIVCRRKLLYFKICSLRKVKSQGSLTGLSLCLHAELCFELIVSSEYTMNGENCFCSSSLKSMTHLKWILSYTRPIFDKFICSEINMKIQAVRFF